MKRVPSIVLISLLMAISLVSFGNLFSETVLISTDYTTPASTIDGDLVLVDGSVRIFGTGDLTVNGDLKITSGSIYIDAGDLEVNGDLIITNTLPAGSASVIVRGAIDVTGEIIIRSLFADAMITTSGGGASDGITAGSIITDAFTGAVVQSNGPITVVGEMDTKSTTSSAFIESLSASVGEIYAGSIVTKSVIDGYVAGEHIRVIGELNTYSSGRDAYVSSLQNIFAGSITTRAQEDATVFSASSASGTDGIFVNGVMSTTSTASSASVSVEGSAGLFAGGIVTNGFINGNISVDNRLRVHGDITTRGATGDAFVRSVTNILLAVNITTSAMDDASVSADDSIEARRNISTYSETGIASVTASTLDLEAYRITTRGFGDSSVISTAGSIIVGGPINTRSINSTAFVSADGSRLEAESIFTNGSGDSYVSCLSSGNLLVKDIIHTKSSAGTAYVHGFTNITARSIETDGNGLAYVLASNGEIDVAGDIRTQSQTDDAYVRANTGSNDVLARSIQTLAPVTKDDSIKSAPGSGKFAWFYSESDAAITIKDSEFYLDSDHVWNTALTLEGTCTLDGNGHKLTFTTDGEIIVAAGANVTLKNFIVNNLSDNSIRCADSAGELFFHDMILNQTSDTLFDTGTFHVYGDLKITGSGTNFKYESTSTSFIHPNARLLLSRGVTLRYDSDTSQRIFMDDSTSRLGFDGGSLYSVDDIRFTNGAIVLDNHVTFSVEAGSSVFLGDGVTANNVDVDFHLRSQFSMHGPLVNDNA